MHLDREGEIDPADLSIERKAHQQSIANEVKRERSRQDLKWGVQRHPNGSDAANVRISDMYRALCDARAKRGAVSWKDILLEETWEAFAEEGDGPLREELIQCAAVIFAWIEDIDARN